MEGIKTMADRLFTAGEAAKVTGISANTAADWRRRGLLPPGGGQWTRYTLRNLAHLRMTAALLEAGIPPSAAIPHAHDLEDSLASQVRAAQAPEAGYAAFVAVIAHLLDGSWYRSTETDLGYLTKLQAVDDAGRNTFNFSTITVVNLGPIAADMAAKIAALDPSAED
jgi:DNA-binding transcriptional MerR regulator